MELLTVSDETGARFIGGSQYWLPREGFMPGGACGATTAANVLMYVYRTRKDLRNIENAEVFREIPLTRLGEKAAYLAFMKQAYPYLPPRPGGLMAAEFIKGIEAFAGENELAIKAERLIVPASKKKRPSLEKVTEFIAESLENDVPLAFLVLSNGHVYGLDNWHWVTILGMDKAAETLRITDNGRLFIVDFATWLNRTGMGGSLIRFVI